MLVCGADDYANAEMVRYALSRLFYHKGALEVHDVGGDGASAGARWYRAARGWEGSTVWAYTAFDDIKPDYLLCFGESLHDLPNKARARGITVGEVL